MKVFGALIMIFGYMTTAPDGWHGQAVFLVALGAVMIYAGSKIGKR